MIIEAILKINPKAKVVVRGKDINTCEIEWLEGTTPIPKADIEAKMNDMLWHSIDQNPKLKSEYFEFYEAIKAVKVKHPKNG